MSIDVNSLRERAKHDQRHEQPMGVNPTTMLALLDRLDAAEHQLSRYSMCAGHAEQRRAESRACREALGFEPDSEHVSPSDLREAISKLSGELDGGTGLPIIETCKTPISGYYITRHAEDVPAPSDMAKIECLLGEGAQRFISHDRETDCRTIYRRKTDFADNWGEWHMERPSETIGITREELASAIAEKQAEILRKARDDFRACWPEDGAYVLVSDVLEGFENCIRQAKEP